MRPPVHPRHLSRLLSTRQPCATRSTRRSPAFEHRRTLATSQPSRGSGEAGEFGKWISKQCVMRYSTPNVSALRCSSPQTVGRRKIDVAYQLLRAPVYILLEHQSLLMLADSWRSQSLVAFHIVGRRQPQVLTAS
jgi:hypothetical protein